MTNNEYFIQTNWKSLLRNNRASYRDVALKHGFGTKRSEPSNFVRIKGFGKYWRDVTSRASMEEKWFAFVKPNPLNFDDVLLEKSEDMIFDLFSSHYTEPLKTVSVMEAVHLLPSDTSAGLPFSPGVRKGDVWKEIIKIAKHSWRTVKRDGKLQICPCRAGARRALRVVGTNKPRLVFAYPAYLNVLETQFTAAFMADPPPFLGWSVNWLDDGLSYDRLVARLHRSRAWANLDFSSFDTSVSPKLIRRAFSIVRRLMDLSKIEESMLSELCEYFIHTPLLMYNQIRYKSRGIPSGSAFTQLIGSIVNALGCCYASQRSREFSLSLNQCIWLGDDSFLSLESGVAKQLFEEDYLSYFKELGLVVNEEKTLYEVRRYGMPVSFLGHSFKLGIRYFDVDCKKLSASITIPENKDRCPEDAAQRVIGLAWAFGCDERAYRMLLHAWIQVRRCNADLSSVHMQKDIRRIFGLYNIEDIDFSGFPSYNEVAARYYGTVLYPVV
nr:RNA-dependent RNA polymerase [Saccharomyces cerevisiae partitivirus 2]WGJ63524.1 RNA-dependent RNA polymerase [Saccharomyces cerevisiae partitivirus 2]